MSTPIFLTLNNSVAPQNLVKINGDIDQPYAQVTVIDADYGDCNVIDVCQTELTTGGSYDATDPSYYRILIDTGPSRAQLDNIIRVLSRFKPPKIRISPSVDSVPNSFANPPVGMVQFTHLDEDHCGQGAALFKAIRTNDTLCPNFVDTKVMFHELPSLDPTLTVTYQPPRIPGNPFTITCNNDERWKLLMRGANFRWFHQFKYQFIATASTAPSDNETRWKLIGPSDNFKVLQSINFDVQYPVPASAPQAIAIRCAIALNIKTKHGRENTVRMGRVQAQLLNSAGKKEDTDVVWQKVEIFGIVPRVGTSTGYIALCVPPRLPPVLPTFQSVKQFVDIKSEFDSLVKHFTSSAATTPTARPWVNASVISATQDDDSNYLPTRSPVPSRRWIVKTVGPTKAIYEELISQVMLSRYKNSISIHSGGIGPYAPLDDLKIGGHDIQNRASIVTMIRKLKVSSISASPSSEEREFDMLFTGDSYDRDCNIQATVAAFTGKDLRQEVDVLKVPHHCSKVTSDTNFYKMFRAKVYLVCGAQYKHGNPSLHTLQEIARGTLQTPLEYAAKRETPTLLFFSDPGSLDDNRVTVNGQTSTRQLLSGIYKPNFDATRGDIYNYRCFRLRKQPGVVRSGAGRIIFGRNAARQLAVQFTTATADSPDDLLLNDWVEMLPL